MTENSVAIGRENGTDIKKTPASAQLDYRDFQRTALVLSGYRSGSHMLKLSLARLAQMQGPPEPLSPYFVERARFNLSDFIAQGGPSEPIFTHATAAFREFLARFYAHMEREQKILFDVKYDQAFTFGVDPLMETTLPAPIVLQEFALQNVPVIHLTRRDIVAQAMSLLVAERSGEFLRMSHVSAGDALPPVRLSPRDVLAGAQRIQHARLHFDRLLPMLGMRVLTVEYEELAAGNSVEVLRSALRFLGRYADVPQGFSFPTQRQGSESSVINALEIRDYIAARAPEILGNTALR